MSDELLVHPGSIEATRTCVTCKYHTYIRYHACMKSPKINIITGITEYDLCEDMRRGFCMRSGDYWQPKEEAAP